MRRNKGIVPDNIGASGEVGEDRDGQWWGGWYGWNCYKGNSIGLTSMTIAAECAHLLSGDAGYLELLRSQMELLFENTRKRDDGQLLVSWRYGPDGWFDYKPMVNKWLPNLYFASLSDEDRQMMEQVRDGDAVRDWGMVQTPGAHAADVFAFFQYHDGKFPDWPEKAMTVELEGAIASLEAVRAESRVKAQIIADNRSIPNPVRTEVLTQMMFGAPGTVYNGGLLRATVRYFDPDRARPGLPLDVAALVDELKPDRSGILLVNLSRHETRKLIVQAGAFGEQPVHGGPVRQWQGGTSSTPGWQVFRCRATAVDLNPSGGWPAPVRQRPQLCVPVAWGQDTSAVPVGDIPHDGDRRSQRRFVTGPHHRSNAWG